MSAGHPGGLCAKHKQGWRPTPQLHPPAAAPLCRESERERERELVPVHAHMPPDANAAAVAELQGHQHFTAERPPVTAPSSPSCSPLLPRAPCCCRVHLAAAACTFCCCSVHQLHTGAALQIARSSGKSVHQTAAHLLLPRAHAQVAEVRQLLQQDDTG